MCVCVVEREREREGMRMRRTDSIEKQQQQLKLTVNLLNIRGTMVESIVINSSVLLLNNFSWLQREANSDCTLFSL